MKNRRQFLAGTATIGIVSVTGHRVLGQGQEETKRLDVELVGKFVAKSHGDFEAVKELMKQEPALINAAWDWGAGDWETGLGAASHTGRRNIAEYLLENGSRIDVFAATMLGIRPVVVEMLHAFPKIHAVAGPHGICLLTHAIFGGEQADEIFALLIEAGANVNSSAKQKTTPLMAAAGLGRIEILETLLQKGADPGAANVNGQTARDIANKKEHQEIVAMLEKAMKKN